MSLRKCRKSSLTQLRDMQAKSEEETLLLLLESVYCVTRHRCLPVTQQSANHLPVSLSSTCFTEVQLQTKPVQPVWTFTELLEENYPKT